MLGWWGWVSLSGDEGADGDISWGRTSGFRCGPSSRDGPGPALVGGSGDIHANQLPRKELLAACQATTLPRSTQAPLTHHPEQGLPLAKRAHNNTKQAASSRVVFLSFHLHMVCSVSIFFSKQKVSIGRHGLQTPDASQNGDR